MRRKDRFAVRWQHFEKNNLDAFELTRCSNVARIERSETRGRSFGSHANPGFHYVQAGLRLLTRTWQIAAYKATAVAEI